MSVLRDTVAAGTGAGLILHFVHVRYIFVSFIIYCIYKFNCNNFFIIASLFCNQFLNPLLKLTQR